MKRRKTTIILSFSLFFNKTISRYLIGALEEAGLMLESYKVIFVFSYYFSAPICAFYKYRVAFKKSFSFDFYLFTIIAYVVNMAKAHHSRSFFVGQGVEIVPFPMIPTDAHKTANSGQCATIQKQDISPYCTRGFCVADVRQTAHFSISFCNSSDKGSILLPAAHYHIRK